MFRIDDIVPLISEEKQWFQVTDEFIEGTVLILDWKFLELVENISWTNAKRSCE